MARELMPKSGILMPYVVVTRDAAVVGVSTVDGRAGALDLVSMGYAKAADYYKKTETYTKTEVDNLITPIMQRALFKDDPFINNNVALRSGGGNGIVSVDMIKVDPNNNIIVGDYDAGVQGVHIYSEGKIDVVYKDSNGQEKSAPLYSDRFRPPVADLPFAAIGQYVTDPTTGRTIGVNRTGENSDLKTLNALTNIRNTTVTFDNPPIITSGLPISSGGTGGLMDVQGEFTTIASPDKSKQLFIRNDGSWGATIPGGNGLTLGVSYGGTGATTPADAANNIGLGQNSSPFFSQVNISTAGYAILGVQNTSRAATDVGARVSLEASVVANSRGTIIQKNNQNTPENQIESLLPSVSGVLAVQGTSGRDYKKDISLADTDEALSRVLSLELVNFVYKDDEKQRVRFGVIAEDAEKIAPQYIKHNQFPIQGTEIFDDEGNKIAQEYQDRPSVDVNPIVMDLLGCIQNLQTQIDDLKIQLASR